MEDRQDPKATRPRRDASGHREMAAEERERAAEIRERGSEGAEATDLGGRIEELESELEEMRDRYLRAVADLDNFRKRIEREQAEMLKSAGERVIKGLLEVLDILDQALGLDPASNSTERFVEGMRLLRERFVEILGKEGLTEIPALGEPFDPNVHEAVMTVESDEHPPDTVVEELQKGYRLHDRLLRPAKVAVAK